MHKDLCFCELIPKLKLETKLTLIIHHRELKRTTNTGRLAINALENSEMRVRGLKDSPLDLNNIQEDEYTPLLLFPSDDAEILTPEYVASLNKKVNLIVPDGNWGQARKVHTRHPEIAHIPRVMIKREEEDEYYLRQEKDEDGMATLQAIAHAYEVIEGEEVGNKLLDLYKLKLTQTQIARGNLKIF